MGSSSFAFGSGAHIPYCPARGQRQLLEQPPPPPRTVEACRKAMVECGAMTHLFAPGRMAEPRILPIDTGHGPLRQLEGYYIKSEMGRVRMALISDVLTGTYIVAPFGGRGYMSLGVKVDAANSHIALVEGGTWKRTVLGRVPFFLPFRLVRPRGRESEAIFDDWLEFPVPDQGLLTWRVHDNLHERREGTYVVGWPGVHRTTTGDREVFIKVIKDPAGLACILENERHLRRAACRNAAIPAFAPLADAVWTQGIDPIASRIPGGRRGCAVVIERLIKGPTLADLATGIAGLAPGGRDRLHSRQIAECGRLAGRGLFALNSGAPRGDRLLAPDATKLDNLICRGTAVNACGEPVPEELVCPDRDHYVAESNPRWRLRGTMFGTDVRSIRAMMADSSFDLVEPAHVFQVGRMLLALSTAGAQPDGQEAYGPDLDANLEVEVRHYARVLALFDRRCGAMPSPPARALGALIRACCDPAPERRPSLQEVIDSCQRIAGLG